MRSKIGCIDVITTYSKKVVKIKYSNHISTISAILILLNLENNS